MGVNLLGTDIIIQLQKNIISINSLKLIHYLAGLAFENEIPFYVIYN